ncbi:MAG: peptidoglycan hydrolase [Ruminococcaceae bacterium]|nr:peptidoglycan hydrolase [Oscillospiraceae bacterium]MBQ8324541.1 SH3 domain-containing protein [Clostridia bacterium]
MPELFLSPSTQEFNIYYDGSGSEEYYMNLIANAMEPYLVASGITFTRNDPEGTVGDSVRQSNRGSYGLHLAIHSNASGSANPGRQQGTDVYYYATSTRGKAAAELFAENLKDIYPDPAKVRALPTTSLYELRYTRAPSILVEVAYHDNPADAEWIKNNIQAIARNLSLSVAEYFGVPLVDPQPTRTGIVRTQGGRLNVREQPSTDARVIGNLNNGTAVTVTGQDGNWYLINYNGLVGFVFGQYLELT